MARFRAFSWESHEPTVTVECVCNEGKARKSRDILSSRNYISVAFLCEHPARKVNNTNRGGDIGIVVSAHPSGETQGERQRDVRGTTVPVWPRPIMKCLGGLFRRLPITLLCSRGIYS